MLQDVVGKSFKGLAETPGSIPLQTCPKSQAKKELGRKQGLKIAALNFGKVI